MNRRDLVKTGLVLSAASLGSPLLAAPKKDKRPVALLLPLTGPRAQLGLSMRRAAMLAESDAYLVPMDTGGSAEGAATAAAVAMKRGAAMVLGPLTAQEIPAVANVVGAQVPIVSFSNDAVLRSDNLFIFGITARQVTSAILRYARSRGVKSVVVIDDESPWSAAAAVAAGQVQAELGIDLRVIQVKPGVDVPNAGEAPDALLLPGSGPAVLAAARNLKGTGVQLLGTVQALDHRPSALEALDGAWLASPDPKTFGTFASEFAARNGGTPGAITALAYDAAGIAKQLRDDGKLGRDGLLSSDGFRCVTGPVRFRTDGSVARDFAILAASRNGYTPVAMSSGS